MVYYIYIILQSASNNDDSTALKAKYRGWNNMTDAAQQMAVLDLLAERNSKGTIAVVAQHFVLDLLQIGHPELMLDTIHLFIYVSIKPIHQSLSLYIYVYSK